MEIQIVTKKPVFDDQHGRLQQGQIIDVPQHKAMFYIQRGEAVCYQTKVLQDRPLADAGTVDVLSALPAVRAYATKTLNELETGEKKKTRKSKQ